MKFIAPLFLLMSFSLDADSWASPEAMAALSADASVLVRVEPGVLPNRDASNQPHFATASFSAGITKVAINLINNCLCKTKYLRYLSMSVIRVNWSLWIIGTAQGMVTWWCYTKRMALCWKALAWVPFIAGSNWKSCCVQWALFNGAVLKNRPICCSVIFIFQSARPES